MARSGSVRSIWCLWESACRRTARPPPAPGGSAPKARPQRSAPGGSKAVAQAALMAPRSPPTAVPCVTRRRTSFIVMPTAAGPRPSGERARSPRVSALRLAAGTVRRASSPIAAKSVLELERASDWRTIANHALKLGNRLAPDRLGVEARLAHAHHRSRHRARLRAVAAVRRFIGRGRRRKIPSCWDCRGAHLRVNLRRPAPASEKRRRGKRAFTATGDHRAHDVRFRRDRSRAPNHGRRGHRLARDRAGLLPGRPSPGWEQATAIPNDFELFVDSLKPTG
jgi:hypothetical protein